MDIEVSEEPAAVVRSAATAYDFPPAHGSGAHRVFLYVPTGAPPEGGWPVLVATDGNAVFDMVVAMMRTQALDPTGSNISEGVIAAVGYQNDGLYDQAGRCWDLTPPPGRRYPSLDAGMVRTGGADHFLDFLVKDMLPWLSRSVPIARNRRTLFGHSFGGLFALYALYRRPALFDIYASASPSLYWEDEAIRPAEHAFFASDLAVVRAQVLLSAGEYEGSTLAPHLRDRADAADLQARLDATAKIKRAQALQQRFAEAGVSTLKSSFWVFAEENHMSVLATALNGAVRAAFATDPCDRRAT